MISESPTKHARRNSRQRKPRTNKTSPRTYASQLFVTHGYDSQWSSAAWAPERQVGKPHPCVTPGKRKHNQKPFLCAGTHCTHQARLSVRNTVIPRTADTIKGLPEEHHSNHKQDSAPHTATVTQTFTAYRRRTPGFAFALADTLRRCPLHGHADGGGDGGEDLPSTPE
jgi:hypothetical protein